MTEGWIKLHRIIKDNPLFNKARYLGLFVRLLLKANYRETWVMFGGKRIKLNPGQFTTGLRVLKSETLIPVSTLQKTLKRFENEKLIEQETDGQCRLITVLNWDRFQAVREESDKGMTSEWETSEKRVKTNKEVKNIRKKEYMGGNFRKQNPNHVKFVEWVDPGDE